METPTNPPSLTDKEYDLHYKLVKMIAALQVSLELMDMLEGTTAYKQEIKFYGKAFTKATEKYLTYVHTHLNDEQSEKTLMGMERAIKLIIDTEINDLYVVGHKED
jgi:hypothetical protein